MHRLLRSLALFTIILSLLVPIPAVAAPAGQTATPPDPQVARILDNLTPEERVGQLFIVTFHGAATDESTPIYDLIANYHIGGVALQAATDNFPDTDTFATLTLELTTALQSLAAQSGGATAGGSTPLPSPQQFIPMFIAMSYADDGFPGNSLLPGASGLTHLPTPMTLGATWNPVHAETVGRITGQELSALGINMLFGPTLDVIETPQPGSPADLGARAFGGDPYWVGKLGRAYIQGVHQGSENRIAVVSQHFPGYGASDRALDEQIPTVNKLLDELKAIDLAPFFAVTRPGTPGDTDALLVSHIRYRGLQGNIRDTTKPISFDPQALGVLLGLPELAAWRANGGVTVSDALGARAVRRFYDPAERTFPAFNIARDAFLAGNDVLYLSQFGNPGADQAETIKTVLGQFVQKYKEDPAFASRVDEAVGRIIALNLKLYAQFTLDAVKPTSGLDTLGAGTEAAFAVTRDAVTLISPTNPGELADRLPTPPSINQQIVFFTDTRITRQCSTCTPRPALAPDALQQAVQRLYGPQGTGETFSSNLSSFTFTDLVSFLDNKSVPATATPPPTPAETATPSDAGPTLAPTALPPGVEESIKNAEWVVIAMLDVRANIPASNAVRRLLAERPDLLRGKRVIVFAFDAPYYLDTTEVAQLDAYYALYNRTSAAVEVAARILFQEITPAGASPVSIPAVSYNLIEVTQPDPNQVIVLTYELPPVEGAAPTPTDSTPAPAAVALNDVVTLRTGVIVDRNGRPVPDGTVVKFYVTYFTAGLTVPLAEETTTDGVASASLRLDRVGTLEVSVASEPALTSFRLQFNVAESPSAPTIITPTPGPTNTIAPSQTPEDTATPEVTPTPTPPGPQPPLPPTGVDLVMTVITLAIMAGVAWRVTNSRVEAVSDGVKLFLIIAIGALAGYNYYALKLPGAAAVSVLGFWAVPLMVWSGGLIGFGAGWWWLRRQKEDGRRTN
ncbi:MAG: glycoside hydrolase family 3 N-terminal domain-containing protein [Chloroflexota bacterium]